jgi:hypothetical protein
VLVLPIADGDAEEDEVLVRGDNVKLDRDPSSSSSSVWWSSPPPPAAAEDVEVGDVRRRGNEEGDLDLPVAPAI